MALATAAVPALADNGLIDMHTHVSGIEKLDEPVGVRAATVNAAAALGYLGANLGSIAPGKIADVVAMKIDPLTHVDQVAEPGKMSFVMKEGKVFKNER
jgi:imidazolonepropionase-like amidohydrolase